MNVDNILKLAEVLESDAAAAHFNMGEWFHHDGDHALPLGVTVAEAIQDCGTVACIAGWAVVAFHSAEELRDVNFDLAAIAANDLGLSSYRAMEIFTPGSAPHVVECDLPVYHATPKQAAKLLRHLAATGEIDWREAFK
jgi:hypothetical protein